MYVVKGLTLPVYTSVHMYEHVARNFLYVYHAYFQVKNGHKLVYLAARSDGGVLSVSW